ncbi:uncharacterized protein PAE49_020941 [Odontesthes bonariensis]|uniref:uncharacterized protein LOC142368665 n=1 Tax=Odontesthes bonariensis TaxID=219752 RepID=UPI003F587447
MLMLQLKRFKFDNICRQYLKIKRNVEFPYMLEMPHTGAESEIYELYAFVEHVGGLKYGYHTVTIKSQDDGKWYNFNDTAVTSVQHQPFRTDITHR